MGQASARRERELSRDDTADERDDADDTDDMDDDAGTDAIHVDATRSSGARVAPSVHTLDGGCRGEHVRCGALRSPPRPAMPRAGATPVPPSPPRSIVRIRRGSGRRRRRGTRGKW